MVENDAAITGGKVRPAYDGECMNTKIISSVINT